MVLSEAIIHLAALRNDDILEHPPRLTLASMQDGFDDHGRYFGMTQMSNAWDRSNHRSISRKIWR